MIKSRTNEETGNGLFFMPILDFFSFTPFTKLYKQHMIRSLRYLLYTEVVFEGSYYNCYHHEQVRCLHRLQEQVVQCQDYSDC